MSTRAERTASIDSLEKDFKESTAIYLTDFNRINVALITKLRSDFRKNGVKYMVVKNTLARKALERCKKEKLVPYLKGQVGMAIAKKEPTAPAKIIKEFRAINKELLGVRIAYVGDALFGQDDVIRLADLPSREVLLSQLLSCFKAPMTNLAGSLSGILTKLAGTLEAVSKQKAAQAA
jgi:large subunit ribosomal protein L10